MMIWDVHKLIAKSKALPVIDIKLSSVKELEENYWFQGNSDEPTCKRIADHMLLVRESDLNFPIILAEDGSVMDGMHRVCKAYLHGHDIIKAVKFGRNPEPDYVNVPLDELPYD